MGAFVFNRPIVVILNWSEHCGAALFSQGGKNHTDVKLFLLYRLILGTYIIFIRKDNFQDLSICCPDTSKRVAQIVTATETQWRNRFIRDWIGTKCVQNHDILRDLNKETTTTTTTTARFMTPTLYNMKILVQIDGFWWRGWGHFPRGWE